MYTDSRQTFRLVVFILHPLHQGIRVRNRFTVSSSPLSMHTLLRLALIVALAIVVIESRSSGGGRGGGGGSRGGSRFGGIRRLGGGSSSGGTRGNCSKTLVGAQCVYS